MSEHVRLTIEYLKVRRQIVSERMYSLDQAIELLENLSSESAEPISLPSELVKPGPVPPKDKPNRRKPGPKSSGRGEKPNRHSTKKLLHYKGVKPLTPKADGTLRFEAHTRTEGKFKYLGTFNIEELAAAAVMEAEGNKPEAKRLREIAKQKAADEAEQQENNPDRSKQTEDNKDDMNGEVENIGGLPPAKRVGVVWQCRKCGHQHPQEAVPLKCYNCGSDFGFRKL